ncbi:MAG: ACT domain-containing protein [Acidobacteria bacterium]|nr:ACT domain-containing protein [Acidobacteriota bacterium]
MAWDIKVTLEDRPGTLAHLGEATGAAGINIDGGCGFLCEEGAKAVFHFLVEDPAAARQVCEAAGGDVGEREVLVVDVDDRPGELGRIARRITDAGVNIDLFYLAADTRFVIGVDDLDAARAAL